jgi:ubiquinone/menaquinone biosynthesis C-methylase UbiE
MPGRLYEATWGRLFAAGYDRFLAGTEKAGLRDRRAGLIASARGRTLELGAGTGLNLPHYPAAVTELVLTEPDPHMAKRLRRRAAADSRAAEVVEAPAEQLPFDDKSFDTAVLTLVLCTVEDPPGALGEIARVLRPDGRLLFLEHVRSTEPGVARWQDRLETPWRWFGDGCHCNRDTLATIEASPLTVDRVERDELPKSPPIVRPLIVGSAQRENGVAA